MKYLILLWAALGLWSCNNKAEESVPPNILWIYVEDISPDIGCYGNELAVTPRLDQLAAEGVLFTNAISPAPVCSPLRSALITGLMHTTIGVHNHHSSRTQASAIHLPDTISTLPELFKEAGYFTFNSGKDDYNFWYQREDLYSGDYTQHALYGKSGQPIDWKTRTDPDQPFFGQIQLRGGKHVFRDFSDKITNSVLRDRIEMPPYYPVDSIFVEEWARYLETHQVTDQEVGDILDRLQQDGVLENTVVFFFADHGMRGLRHKQFLYDGGLRVPLIMADFRKVEGAMGLKNDNLVNLLDISATTLALAGIPLPNYLAGKDLLAEDYQPHEYIISARDRCDFTIDRIRSVRSTQYKYIRNFLTDRPLMQPNYRDEWESTKYYRKLHEEGQLNNIQAHVFGDRVPEELYDLVHDPHETVNLIDSPQVKSVLATHRQVLETWIDQTDDQGQYAENEEGLKYMLGIWGEQAVNPEYDQLRESYPGLSGSLNDNRFGEPQLVETK